MLPRAVFLALCAFALTACAQTSADRPASTVSISPELTILLPHPSDLGQPVESTQLVVARYGDESYAFESHVSASPERFLMVGLDSLGRKAMTITWTDAAITYEVASWLPSQLRPENILADMVLMYWPEDSVRQALKPSSGTLLSEPQRRSVMYGDREVIRIEYASAQGASPWSGQLRYHHLVWNYQLDIQTVEAR